MTISYPAINPYQYDRNHSSTTLPTLVAYLSAAHPLLAVILQIPPLDPQAALRSSLLLRLTGEIMSSITGYQPTVDSLPILLSWLDELDRGWLAVLQSQIWDPDSHSGVDFIIPSDSRESHIVHFSPISQTDRTRLRSILVSGITALEEWLETLDIEGAEDLPSALERLGATQEFDDLFHRTLSEMGELEGAPVLA